MKKPNHAFHNSNHPTSLRCQNGEGGAQILPPSFTDSNQNLINSKKSIKHSTILTTQHVHPFGSERVVLEYYPLPYRFKFKI